jgi:outer membrane protein TolC
MASIQSQLARFTDSVALYQALGGGWGGENVAQIANK